MNLNQQQRAAMETTGHDLCVDAAAGSGKTTVLIGRMARLLEQGVDLDHIVAITFTEMAAGEMRQRLRARCRAFEAASSGEAAARWRNLARRAENARVSTIHAFCAGILREHALGFGMDPDRALLAEADGFMLREEVVTDAVARLLADNDPSALCVAELAGVRGLQEWAREALAGRDALADALAADLPEDPAALADLWRAQTEALRAELLEDLKDSAVLSRFKMQLRMFDGLCANPREGREALRQHMLAGIARIRKAGNAGTVRAVLADFADSSTRGDSKAWPDKETMEALKKVQDKVKEWAKELLGPAEEDMSPEGDAPRFALASLRVAGAVCAAYREAKEARGVLDFDDLISLCQQILRDRPDLCARVAGGIRHLLVDEFQDTDPRQFAIVSLLQQANPGIEVFIVGDAKQSIYRFRGAEVGVFREARAGREVIRLNANYRTVPGVIAFINHFFGTTRMLLRVEPEYLPMEAARPGADEARVQFLIPEDDTAETMKEARLGEADLVASRLAAMCGEDSPRRATVGTPDGGSRPACYGDAAMLFRSYANIHLYERALRARGVPYQVVSGRGFYERQEVRDFVNLLTAVADPWDEPALLGFLRSPLAALSDDALVLMTADAALAAAFRGGDVPAELSEEDREALDAARELVNDLRGRMALPLAEFLRHALDRSGAEALAITQHLGLQKAMNLRKITDLAADFSQRRPPSLLAFTRYVREAGAARIQEGDAPLRAGGANAVLLLTIHKSKGLEFPIVVVPDLARDQKAPAPGRLSVRKEPAAGFPVIACKEPDDEGEWKQTPLGALVQAFEAEGEAAESARLLYVAMTRARDWLLLGSSNPPREGHTWLEPFDALHRVSEKKHGEILLGDGWSMAILREAPGAAPSAEAASAAPDWPAQEDLERRIAPVSGGGRKVFRISVSALASFMAKADRSAWTRALPTDGRRIPATVRGTALHAALRQWDFRSDPGPAVDRAVAEAGLGIAASEAMRADLRATAGAVATNDWGRRVADDAGALREQSFMLRLGDALLVGQIDVLLSDGTVVDYKTGRWHEELAGQYEWQLRLYALAARELAGRTPAEGWLYYVDAGPDGDPAHRVSLGDAVLDATRTDALAALERLRAGGLPTDLPEEEEGSLR